MIYFEDYYIRIFNSILDIPISATALSTFYKSNSKCPKCKHDLFVYIMIYI